MARIEGERTFDAEVIGSGLLEAKTGSGQITIRFQDDAGDTITAFLACTQNAWPYTSEKLKTLGWDPAANGFRFEDLAQDPSPILGARVEVVTTEETHEGKTRTKVAFINPIGGGVERMSPDQAVAFAAKLRQRLGVSAPGAAARRPVARPAARPAAPAAPAGEDDAIPEF